MNNRKEVINILLINIIKKSKIQINVRMIIINIYFIYLIWQKNFYNILI